MLFVLLDSVYSVELISVVSLLSLWIEGESESMEAFDHLLSGPVSEYLKTSTAIGGDVAKHVSVSGCEYQCQCRFYRETRIQTEDEQR